MKRQVEVKQEGKKQTKQRMEVTLLYICSQSKLSINWRSYLIHQRYPVRLTSSLVL